MTTETEKDVDDDLFIPANEEHEEKLRLENDLHKVNEEIRALKQVLQTKEAEATRLRRLLGITPLQVMSKEVGAAFEKIKSNDNLSKFGEQSKKSFSAASQYTWAGLTNFGEGVRNGTKNFVNKGINDVRNSSVMASVGEKFSSVTTSLKSAVGGTRTGDQPTDKPNQSDEEKLTSI